MGMSFTIVLIQRTRLEEPDGYIKRDGLPDVAQFYWPQCLDDWDGRYLYLSSNSNLFCWRKLLEVMRLNDHVNDWIQVQRNELRELKRCLKESLDSRDNSWLDKLHCEAGLVIIEQALKEHKNRHAILVDYS